jgi:predicted dehydrogenase
MSKLRHVLIGAGAGVLGMHLPGLQLDSTEVVGVSDISEERGAKAAQEFNAPYYADYEVMLRELQPDIAVIMTPHPFHARIAIDALQAGCHVLVEKPIAVEIAEADAMIRAAREANRLLAVNFQQRLRPEIMAARKLLNEGALGKIQHVDVKVTWTRTAIYYRSSNWRGTWNGEGGALLMNQAPHELDLICHLFGLPARVVAWTRNFLHPIEAEDTIQAMVEWEDGALGSIHISTGEAGQPQRFDITGTRGRLELSPGGCRYQVFESDLRVFSEAAENGFASPSISEHPIEIEESEGTHRAVYQNLHNAILNGSPLLVDAESAALSLQLANAMTLSSHQKTQVEFPLNRRAYSDLLADLRRQSQLTHQLRG